MPDSLFLCEGISNFLHESPNQNDTLGNINEYIQLDAHLESHKYRQEDRAAVLMPAVTIRFQN